MSSESLNYDNCSYEQKLRESIGPGSYMLSKPANDCTQCSQNIPTDPYLRYQSFGSGLCPPGSTVGTESDLMGITRKASKCAADQYNPARDSPVQTPVCKPKTSLDCRLGTEPTRYSNPVCTLKETGINRWEWLCWNPQDRAIIPFEWNTSYRTVVKDNFTPCIPQPIDQEHFMPSVRPSDKGPMNYRSDYNNGPVVGQQTGVSCKAIGQL